MQWNEEIAILYRRERYIRQSNAQWKTITFRRKRKTGKARSMNETESLATARTNATEEDRWLRRGLKKRALRTPTTPSIANVAGVRCALSHRDFEAPDEKWFPQELWIKTFSWQSHIRGRIKTWIAVRILCFLISHREYIAKFEKRKEILNLFESNVLHGYDCNSRNENFVNFFVAIVVNAICHIEYWKYYLNNKSFFHELIFSIISFFYS